MQLIRLLILSVLFVGLVFPPWILAVEKQNLDEVMTRKSRYSTNTFFSGEAGTYYFWQPETLSWTDTNYSTEVWRLVWKPYNLDIYSKEYSTEAWSHDGSRMGFFDLSSQRTSGDPNKDAGITERWIVNADGTKLRVGTGRGYSIDNAGFGWLHTEAGYLFFPSTGSEFSGAETDGLYKVTLDSNNSTTRSLLLHINDGVRKVISIKDPISTKDSWIVAEDYSVADWPTPNNINSAKMFFIRLSDNTLQYSWGSARKFGPDADPYNNHVQSNESRFRGSSSTAINPDAERVLVQFTGEGIFWDVKNHGSATDDGPAWEDWDGDSFGVNEEIKAVMDDPSGTPTPHNPYQNGYAGHISPDRWGHYAQLGYSGDENDPVDWGDGSGKPGRMIVDMSNNFKNPSFVDANNTNYIFGFNSYQGGHSSWTAWNDWTVAVSADSNSLQQNLYNKTTQTGKTNYRAYDTIVTTEVPTSITSNYNANPRPSQSPDGTKVVFATCLFHSPYGGTDVDDDYVSITYVVAHNPYPSEIYSVSAIGGTVTVRGDWGIDSGIWKGYTQRKWPDESTGTYLPPREINKWRLWRSTDKVTWTPLTPVTANAWDRYNFATGVWSGNTYWDLADTPGDGTWYYAITAIETSGLESKTLSNIFAITISSGSGTGAEDTGYPASPGVDSDFYTIVPSAPQTLTTTHQKAPATATGQYTIEWTEPETTTLVRYYNIYALDSYNPTAIQQRRIASISRNICSGGNCSWVDWLGDTFGDTRYGITSVDSLGNESSILTDEEAPPAYKSIYFGGGSQSITIGGGSHTISW